MENTPSPKANRTFFVDSENHINTCLEGIDQLGEHDLVVVFHRESNLSKKQVDTIAASPARIEWILCQDSGIKNSLDVQLIAELSRRIALGEVASGYIISQDQGYQPAIHYLLSRYARDLSFLGLKKSISEFMLADALISAQNKQDVNKALVRYAGQIIGTNMYKHLKYLYETSPSADGQKGGRTAAEAPLFSEEAPEPLAGEDKGSAPTPKPSKRRKPKSQAARRSNKAATEEPQHAEKPGQGSSPDSGKAPDAAAAPAPDAAAAPVPDAAASPAPVAAASQNGAGAPTPQAPAETAAPKAPRARAPRAATQLVSLPNIGKTLAAKLESVGIKTPRALKGRGSRKAWLLLRQEDAGTSINWLYALEGAILNIPVKELDAQTKTSLKEFSRQQAG